MHKVVVVKGENHSEMVKRGLSELKIDPEKRKIVIKPNLIDNRPYPITTNVKTVEGIAEYFIDKNKAYEIIVAEGSGWCSEGTLDAFVDLGYMELAEKYKIKLKDLNEDEYDIMENPGALVLKKFERPKTLKDAYLISAAVLKKHSMCTVTLSLKNMLGATILSNKQRFHRAGVNESIVDINMYEKPDLAVIDAVVGNLDHELGWKPVKFNQMIFSEDLVAADAVASKILGADPKNVRHLNLAQEMGLGTMDFNKIDVKILE